MKKLKVFISYSHADEEHKRNFKKFVYPSIRDDVVDVWDDSKILPGEEIDDEIKKELFGSDVVVFLISQSFITSSYCYDTELQETLLRMREEGVRIFPVILDYCTWKKTHIKNYKVIPYDGTPVVEYENQNKAWMEVHDIFSTVVDEISSKLVAENSTDEELNSDQNFPLTREFKDFLSCHEMVLHSRRLSKKVTLDNLYVWPNFSSLIAAMRRFFHQRQTLRRFELRKS